MTLRYTLTEEDYILFNLYHSIRTPALRRQMRAPQLLFPVVLGLYLLVFGRSGPPIFYLALFAVASVLWVLLLPRLYRRSIRQTVRAQWSGGAANEFTGPQTLALLEDRIRKESDGRLSETAYRHVTRIVQTPQALYIYVGALSAYIVPVTAVERPEYVAALTRLLTERTGLEVQTDSRALL